MHPRRLEQRILRHMMRANKDYGLFGEGDRVLVALSGGKDSFGLLWGLMQLRAVVPFSLELVAYHLDQGQPGHVTKPIEDHVRALGVPMEVEFQDTYTRVVELTEPGKIYCSLCSRFRRAILYRAAMRHGCNKVALGHHADDTVETLMLNLFHAGQLKAMPPRLRSDTGTCELIRPLCYVPESELIELAGLHQFPIVPCRLCGSLDGERKAIRKLLAQASLKYPHLKRHILAAMGNVVPTHLFDKAINPLYAPSGAARESTVAIDDDADCSVVSAPMGLPVIN